MPTRSRAAAAAATAVEVVEQAEPTDAPRILHFDEPLSWRAGRPIPIGELLRRLSTLSKELRDMEQEENDRQAFTKVAKELAGYNLLAHKDKGVRAWTACCLVDILRLCAPDAPYTGAQLKEIFTLIVTSILPALSDPSNAYNNQHMYVLQSLAQVKSIVLLTDIPSSDSLIVHLFTSFFDILSGTSKSSTGEQLAKNVEYHMTSVLVILVDEASHLPVEVVDVILAQFLRADPRVLTSGGAKQKRNGESSALDDKQSTLLLKEYSPAYNMAKTICNSCPDKMARYVSQYFNDVIMDASSSVMDGTKHHPHRKSSVVREDSDDEAAAGPTEEDLKDLHKAHQLLRELWRSSPEVLQNVIPQVDAELSAENVQLRLLATETLGDIVSGIGAAGPPAPPSMDPAAYPPQTLDGSPDINRSRSILTTPSSPQPFPQTYHTTYHSFLMRKQDKSAVIRSAWATAIGKILSTSAGGIGLGKHDERDLMADMANTLIDSDERVRIAAIKAISMFGFQDLVLKLGSIGGVDKEGSILYNLAERARDRKPAVRAEAIMTLGRIWGVAAGEIAAENETVIEALGSIPSKLFDTFYVNDLEINVLLENVLYEQLLPLGYPPVKSKALANGATGSQSKSKESQTNGSAGKEGSEWDRIRTERILTLVRGLDAKAKKAFFAVQGRQVPLSAIVHKFLKMCEEYNGGVMDSNTTEIKSQLTRLINYLAETMPDSPRVSADLWKFAKMHDRRSYQLMRFCMDPNSDYRTVVKAIREFSKRIEAAPASSASILESLRPLLYRVSVLVYNKNHIPTIVELSSVDGSMLGTTAHEFLKEISTRHPEVFKAHVKELCRILQEQAPTDTKPNEPGTFDTLKACASFAGKFPKEMPQERTFFQSLMKYAHCGDPPATAKYAVTIILACAEKREMYAKDLLQKSIKGFTYGSDHFLSRLATLSQVVRLAPKEAEEESDAVVDIAIKEILLQVRTPAKSDKPEWVSDDSLDNECKAKIWALKILVNRLRSHSDPKTLRETAQPVFQLLNTLIAKEGELSKRNDTPPSHKSRFRLLASQLFLKLCSSKEYDALLSAKDFNRLACMAQDSILPVRTGFMSKLKKYLVQNRLPHRFYTIAFLQAFEPSQELREDTVTWIRARAKLFAQKKSTAMEAIFARLLSLLAHHPDFSTGVDDLCDFAVYVLFYLRTVATEDNLSLIYYMAQRVKQTTDAISPDSSENLYYLSDLAQAVIRRYEDLQGWSMQAWPGRMGLPSSLFGPLSNHDRAQEIATKTFLPDEVMDRLDALVKAKAKPPKKRKPDDQEGTTPPKKKAKASSSSGTAPKQKPKFKTQSTRKAAAAKTPKPKKTRQSEEMTLTERRRSGRTASAKVATYAEESGSEADDVVDHDEDEDEDMEAATNSEQLPPGKEDSDGGEDHGDEAAESDRAPDTEHGKNGKKATAKQTVLLPQRAHPKPDKKAAAVSLLDDDSDGSELSELSDPPDSD